MTTSPDLSSVACRAEANGNCGHFRSSTQLVLIGNASFTEELGVFAWAVIAVSLGELQAGVLMAGEPVARAVVGCGA